MNVIVKLQNFDRKFQLNYKIFFPVLNIFTGDTEEYSLDVNYKVNDAKALKKTLSSEQFHVMC